MLPGGYLRSTRLSRHFTTTTRHVGELGNFTHEPRGIGRGEDCVYYRDISAAMKTGEPAARYRRTILKPSGLSPNPRR